MVINQDYLFGDKQIKQMGLSSMKPIGITVHNTYNSAPAINEAKNQFNNNTKKGSSGVAVHFYVDEDNIYQLLPLNIHGWHAGDGATGKGNRQTIAIEICRSTDYSDDKYARAEGLTVKLIEKLLKDFNFTTKDIYQHQYWSGKKCPHRLIEGNPINWNTFIGLIGKGEEPKPTPKPEPKPDPKPVPKPTPPTNKERYNQVGRFTANTKIYYRDNPNVDKTIGYINKGDVYDYKEVWTTNGHVWIGNGETWLPTGEAKSGVRTGNVWGTFGKVPDTPKPPVTPPVNKPDQILHPGEKFIFGGPYRVDGMKKFNGVWAVYNKELKAYITVGIVNKTDSKGNKTANQVLHNGDYFKVPGTFIVEKVVGNTIYPKGWGFGVDAKTLLEV